jgi:hypothetical protein
MVNTLNTCSLVPPCFNRTLVHRDVETLPPLEIKEPLPFTTLTVRLFGRHRHGGVGDPGSFVSWSDHMMVLDDSTLGIHTILHNITTITTSSSISFNFLLSLSNLDSLKSIGSPIL